MKLNLDIQNWHLVSEYGYPDDHEWCIYAWQTINGDIEWAVGGYNADNRYFYADYGSGLSINEAESVLAWVSFNDIKLITEE